MSAKKALNRIIIWKKSVQARDQVIKLATYAWVMFVVEEGPVPSLLVNSSFFPSKLNEIWESVDLSRFWGSNWSKLMNSKRLILWIMMAGTAGRRSEETLENHLVQCELMKGEVKLPVSMNFMFRGLMKDDGCLVDWRRIFNWKRIA